METVNRGFLVRSDRFDLLDPHCFLLRGYMVEGAVLEALADGAPAKTDVTICTGNYDENFGGVEARVRIGLPPTTHKLRLYATVHGHRHLCYIAGDRELRKKDQAIHTFLDDVVIKDGRVQVGGWAVGRETLDCKVTSPNGSVLASAITWHERLDVSELYDEMPSLPPCGFLLSFPKEDDDTYFLTFSDGTNEAIVPLHTNPLRTKWDRASHIVEKGRKYFLYNGPAAFVGKVTDYLLHPERKRVVYGEWIKKHLPDEKALEAQRERHWEEDAPHFSVVVPLYRTGEEVLVAMIESVLAQTYPRFELLLSDGSGQPSPLEQILMKFREDPRVRVLSHAKPMKIAENTNAAIEASEGDYIVFLDHDDLLTPHALYEMASYITAHPGTMLLYSDEDKISEGEVYYEPFMKPDYAPDFLRSCNYINHLCVIARSLMEEVGLLDPSMDGAQDYDLVLRCCEKTDRIAHIPEILYHWRSTEGSVAADPQSKAYAYDAGARALCAHYTRLGLPATAERGEVDGTYRTRWAWKETPLVTVMIPNKDHVSDLKTCIRSLIEHTAYPQFEILIIENNSTEKETFSYYEELKQDPRIRVMNYSGAFNYAAINNAGAKEAKGAYLLLLNNDTELITDVISEMMGYAMRPDVGIVGARMYYADDSVQHGGVILGFGGVAGHAFVNIQKQALSTNRRFICAQDLSAVTAAAMMVRKDVFFEVSGMTEELAVAFNDIDFCLKVRTAGYLVVYDPYAELYHYESKSRGLEDTPEKKRRFQKESTIFKTRWKDVLAAGDPYYNPHLSMVTQDFSLKNE